MRLALAVVLVVAASAAAQEGPVKRPGPSGGGAAAADSSSIVVDHGRSVLQELRERGGKADDFPTSFKSETIVPGQHTPVKTVERFAVDGAPIFHFTQDLSAVVVDARRAGDLRRVDATRLAKGQRAVVGSWTPETLAALGLRDAALLLVHAGVIGTYWHIGATLRVTAERPGELDLEGTHEYFTNERNEGRVAFTVAVSRAGEVVVVGR